jgi:hypothetical protein
MLQDGVTCTFFCNYLELRNWHRVSGSAWCRVPVPSKGAGEDYFASGQIPWEATKLSSASLLTQRRLCVETHPSSSLKWHTKRGRDCCKEGYQRNEHATCRLPCDLVTIDGVLNWWPDLLDTLIKREYISQFTITHRLVSTVMFSLPLLCSGF